MIINLNNIRIIDPEIQAKLMYYSKKYKYRFIANSLSFSSSINLSFDIEKDDNKNILYKTLVAKACDGCSTAPVTHNIKIMKFIKK